MAFVPQWDFLDLITATARRYPTFRLRMNAEAVGLIEEEGVICGVRYEFDGQVRSIRSLLTVAADGRSSKIRKDAGLVPKSILPAMDVLWFRIPRGEGEPQKLSLMIATGHILLFINRFEYWQVAYSVPKVGEDTLRPRGLEAFTRQLAVLKPKFADRFMQLSDRGASSSLSRALGKGLPRRAVRGCARTESQRRTPAIRAMSWASSANSAGAICRASRMSGTQSRNSPSFSGSSGSPPRLRPNTARTTPPLR